MRVLYVASNPEGEVDLGLEREITELQGRFVSVSGEPVSFIFLPSVKIEDLADAISRHRPDILHISAHGTDKALSFSNSSGKNVDINAARLKNLLDEDALPRLIYLNACNSHKIAEDLVDMIPMAIGTTAPITNRAARAGAKQFYERILQGRTVNKSFEASSSLIETLEHNGTITVLKHRANIDPSIEIFHQIPRLVARFYKERFSPKANGEFSFEVGVLGCSRTTSQLLVFTNDKTFIKNDMVNDLCSISMDSPIKGEIWMEETWSSSGDIKLFACGVTSDDLHFVTNSLLCDALESYYKLKLRDPMLKKLNEQARRAIAGLRQMDGAEMWAVVTDQDSGKDLSSDIK